MGQKFDSEVLNLVKQKRFYPYEQAYDFEKFNKKLPSKKKFHSSLSGKGIRDEVYQHVLQVLNKFEMKTLNDYHNLYLKCDVLL